MAFNGTEGEVISLEIASEWTAAYRGQNSDEEGNAVFFGRDHLLRILSQEDCMGIRIYFGVDDKSKKALILVGADSQENDQTSGVIVDRGVWCPTICGDSNSLNS